jgi:hypothetical protein
VKTGDAAEDNARDQALDNLANSGSPAVKNLIKTLRTNSTPITVHKSKCGESLGGETSGNKNGIDIRWNPNIAGVAKAGTSYGSPSLFFSADEMLLHELGHADDLIRTGTSSETTPLNYEANYRSATGAFGTRLSTDPRLMLYDTSAGQAVYDNGGFFSHADQDAARRFYGTIHR